MSEQSANRNFKWWQKTSIYQIWPRSFFDSNGDGIGDLKGIIAKLDYVKGMGFEAIWLSPFFTTPFRDSGYDVSDYCDVSPEYGSLADAQLLIDTAHQKGLRIIFDLVMGHTSIEHPWFKESRSSKTNPKRDWYIWKPGKGKKPPNNWKSMVGNRGWQYDATTDEWFYTSFLKFQPDLNYHNPAVKKAMFDNARFWLNKGADGYRLDIFNCIHKDESFRDNPFSWKYFPAAHTMNEAFFQKKIYSMNHAKSFELARELRAVIDEFPGDRFVIGEVSGDDLTIKQYLGDAKQGLNLIFMFENLEFTFTFFRKILQKHARNFPYPYMPTCVFGNHDVTRIMSKLKGDQRKAKLLALYQFTVRAVPVSYYGDEIGIVNGDTSFRMSGDGIAQQYKWLAKPVANALGLFLNREDAKAPMQWDRSANAGFTRAQAKPWLPVNPDFKTKNVRQQLCDENSLLLVYRKLLHLRKSNPLFSEGDIELLPASEAAQDLLVYRRSLGSAQALVLINFGCKRLSWNNNSSCKHILFSIHGQTQVSLNRISLDAFGGLIVSNA
ncbi:MAG: alpha-amylase family glycosyl hydrolase [Pseudobdellovibrionaceae bacterium]|nr:alpha-amylase family glycosyl hydrolase [Pseudobdellovibrionaceae bacterium]